MNVVNEIRSPEVASILNSGGIAVVRTDTLYGVVAKADNEAAVERVYDLKHRDDTKSPIVLIRSRTQLYDPVPKELEPVLQRVWPGKVSVIVPSVDAPQWIRRSNDSVAYRLPDNDGLQQLLSLTGPLIAPSANPQGKQPAISIDEAIDYFGSQVDVYVDGGTVTDNTPSELFRVDQYGVIEKLR